MINFEANALTTTPDHQFYMYMYVTGFVWTTLCQVVDDRQNVTACYVADAHEFCFYTDGTKLSWNEARDFCAGKNATLPIIRDENADNVFQQFLVNLSRTLILNTHV